MLGELHTSTLGSITTPVLVGTWSGAVMSCKLVGVHVCLAVPSAI